MTNCAGLKGDRSWCSLLNVLHKKIIHTWLGLNSKHEWTNLWVVLRCGNSAEHIADIDGLVSGHNDGVSLEDFD